MSQYVSCYVATCDPCLQTKVQHQWPTSELQPLPVLEKRWEVMSMDFIVELPESGGYDVIMVVVDLVGKWAHFMETVTTVTVASAANLYLRHVWKHHSLPHQVISDRGPQFVAAFMKEPY